jgi:plasmid stabilization system protein ParE
MRKIELSQQAQLRLTEITDYYLAHESLERTIKVIEFFETSFTKIAENPFVYRRFLSNEFINIDIRICSHYKTYHIYFIIYPDVIKISEIFHLKQGDDKLKIDL